MSPSEAFADPIVRRYALLLAVFLGASGLALAIVQFVFKRSVAKVWVIYRSWLVMAPLTIAVIVAGREATIAFFTLAAIVAFKEFSRATGLYHDWWLTGAVYIAIAATGVTTWVGDPNFADGSRPGWYGLFMTLPVFCILLFLLIPIVRDRTRGQLQAVSLAIVGYVYIGWMFGHYAFLANCPHAYGYLLYVLLATEVNDVAAFTFGKLLGRHKLRPAISPNKTWEGALGALAVSLALPWALSFSFPHFGAWQLIWTGLIVGIGGQLGDLSISFIKRDLGIKDMGVLIPGHGGILDRIDSLIFVAPLFLHLVDYVYKHW